jgi:hypothetical protein
LAGLRTTIGDQLRRTGLIHVPPGAFTPTQLDQLATVLAPLEQRLLELESAQHEEPPFDILDAYHRDVPSPQTAVDLFAGEWASRLPLPGVSAGTAPLFEIEHVPWGVELLGGVQGQRVLELGPLEGGHTYLLDRMGAAEVVAVEANSRGFLKCLIAKELVGIPSARFMLGDAVRHLEDHLAHEEPLYDLVLASGILYHLVDPVAALDLMTRASDRLVLWTMYYDEQLIRSREDLSVRFPSSSEHNHRGFVHTLHGHEYQHSLDYKGFCGGSAAGSAWLSRDDLFAAIDFLGFDVEGVGFEELDHKGNGPCICIAARRRS